MTRIRIGGIITTFWLFSIIYSLTDVHANPDTGNWAIGLQGNMPLWGGLSVKYMGLGRVHLQFIEHYVQNGEEFSVMGGVQTPIVLARYPLWTRLYLAPGFGIRKNREIQNYYVNRFPNLPINESFDTIERIVDETTLGGALLVGLEIFLDTAYGNKDSSRYSLNIEFGQGIGQIDRKAKCEDEAGNPVDCTGFSEVDYLKNDPDEKEGKSFRASFVLGAGFHFYF